jgi:hypothetical protein
VGLEVLERRPLAFGVLDGVRQRHQVPALPGDVLGAADDLREERVGDVGTSRPRVWLRRVVSVRAAWLGRYSSWSMARCTLVRVVSRTSPLALMTRDTVIVDTPARRATSAMVTRFDTRAPVRMGGSPASASDRSRER